MYVLNIIKVQGKLIHDFKNYINANCFLLLRTRANGNSINEKTHI